jgi:DNA polymerase I-like protein with 3'-5' exonuclease and polymerase domains
LTLDTNRPWSFFEAADLHRQYLEKCSGIKDYQEMCHRLADPQNPQATRIWDVMTEAPVTFIESPCGRKRFFPPDSKNVYTEACNHPIQGMGATMTKAAMVLIAREVLKRGWYGKAYLVNAIHDELVMEADADIAPAVAVMMKEAMERAGAFYIKDVKIVASFPTEDGTAAMWVKE